MADTKITDLTAATGVSLADNDEFVVVDISSNETKSITRSELITGIVNTAGVTSAGAIMNTGGTLSGDLQVKGVRETVLAITGTTPDLDPTNGTIQTWTLSGNSTPTFASGWNDGESILIMVDDGTGSVISSFPTMKWSGGSAPTLATTGYSVITIWKVGGVFYGISAGSMT
tara:strand:+ start:224 stop:739 length:516 start_codon:yes stop_codon:yes gene_type:complete